MRFINGVCKTAKSGCFGILVFLLRAIIGKFITNDPKNERTKIRTLTADTTTMIIPNKVSVIFLVTYHWRDKKRALKGTLLAKKNLQIVFSCPRNKRSSAITCKRKKNLLIFSQVEHVQLWWWVLLHSSDSMLMWGYVYRVCNWLTVRKSQFLYLECLAYLNAKQVYKTSLCFNNKRTAIN